MYLVETFKMTAAAREDPAFWQWMREFNQMCLKNNPYLKSIRAYITKVGDYSLDVWFEFSNYTDIEKSEKHEVHYLEDPKFKELFKKFFTYLEPVSRKILDDAPIP